jgi:uncharacterized protein (TIGR02421 family)
MEDLLNGDDDPPSRPLSPYEQTVRQLSDRLVEAQRAVRVLDAVQWDGQIEQVFFANGGRELPPVTAETYAARPLRFNPAQKAQDFRSIERDCVRRLGRDDPASVLLRRRCRQYRRAVAMLANRGTPAFARLSRELYGGPGRSEDSEVAAVLAQVFRTVPRTDVLQTNKIDAAAAVVELNRRLRKTFPEGGYKVKLADAILADAAAGCNYVKLRRNASFTMADLALLEVHEGWVHLGTTLNGRRQSVCSFLGKGPPSTTVTQEGLAVLCEILAGVSHACRVRKLWRRYQAVRLADAGADFRDVYRFFLDHSDDGRDSFHQAARVFRGSLPNGGGPFAKDLAYALGLTRVMRAIRHEVQGGGDDRLTLLFCGKVALDELPILNRLVTNGQVRPPMYVPQPLSHAVALRNLISAPAQPTHRLSGPHLFDEDLIAPLEAPAVERLCFPRGDDDGDSN